MFDSSGTPLEKGVVVSILRGEIMENVPLELYGFVHRYRDIYKDIKSSLGMKNSLTEKLLNRYYCMLFEKKQAQYRENNPVVYEWGYNPPHFRDIGEQTDLLFHRLATEGKAGPVNPGGIVSHGYFEDLSVWPRQCHHGRRCAALYSYGKRYSCATPVCQRAGISSSNQSISEFRGCRSFFRHAWTKYHQPAGRAFAGQRICGGIVCPKR